VANALKPDSFESGFFLCSLAERRFPQRDFHPGVMLLGGLTTPRRAPIIGT
jgi:hypothetical protein